MAINKLVKYHFLMLCFIGTVIFLASCKNKDLPLPVIPSAYVSIVNATADTLNFFVNGSRQNSLSSIYSSGAYTAYIPSGTQNYQVKKSGTATVLFSGSYSLADTSKGNGYSFFIAGETTDRSFFTTNDLDSAQTILDSAKKDTTAMIRFVNAAYSAGGLNVVFDKGDTINISNANFKYASKYFSVYEGTRNIKVYSYGSTTPLLEATLTLQAGAIYTLFAEGVLNGKGNNAFNVELMLDNTLTQ